MSSKIPEGYTEFLYWVKERTENFWSKNPKTSDSDFNQKVAGILGLGLKDSEGHHRISKGPFFHLMEGTEAGHAAMLALCLHIQTVLEEEGRDLNNLTKLELIEIIQQMNAEED